MLTSICLALGIQQSTKHPQIISFMKLLSVKNYILEQSIGQRKKSQEIRKYLKANKGKKKKTKAYGIQQKQFQKGNL